MFILAQPHFLNGCGVIGCTGVIAVLLGCFFGVGFFLSRGEVVAMVLLGCGFTGECLFDNRERADGTIPHAGSFREGFEVL